ncbi:VCBS domain-containing protein [Catenovulum agarivorans]|uniref:VCBS domain-containing protein n=1 Tax=Catenovulum agarivorans TaxID=1172192 RepID=UPI000313D6B9|nr:VCBS domain-containing protein [Catenovulum agarivorans]
MNMKKCLITAAMALSLTACELDTDSTGDNVSAPENLPAVILGDLTHAIQNDAGDLQGKISVSDPDAGENGVIEQVSMATTYGTFSIDFAGNWVYTVNTSDATVANLVDENDSIVDVITITSIDGVTANIEITINGQPSTPMVTNNVLKITDTDSGDSGELREKFGPLTVGKLNIRFNKEEVLTADGSVKEAYIALWGTSTSTSNALVDLRISNGSFKIREATTDVTPTFTLNEWNDVEITWDATNATDTVAPLVTVKINGVDSGLGTFSSFSKDLPSVMAGADKLVLKLSDNSSIVNGAVYYDDIVIYSDLTGTTKVFEEDFEAYAADFDLSSVYTDSATNEAVVAQQTSSAPVVTTTKVAKISDTDSGDSGELRHEFENGALKTGKITARFNKDEVLTSDGSVKEAYIALWGTSTSTSNALVDLRISNGSFKIREATTDVTPTFNIGEWVDVEMTWDATNASDTVAPLVTVKINGVDSGLGQFSSFSKDLSAISGGVTKLVLKLSDNSATVTGSVYYDDLKVYSDVAGTTLEWEEDFETYSADYDLSITYDDSATNEAVVAEKDL